MTRGRYHLLTLVDGSGLKGVEGGLPKVPFVNVESKIYILNPVGFPRTFTKKTGVTTTRRKGEYIVTQNKIKAPNVNVTSTRP